MPNEVGYGLVFREVNLGNHQKAITTEPFLIFDVSLRSVDFFH